MLFFLTDDTDSTQREREIVDIGGGVLRLVLNLLFQKQNFGSDSVQVLLTDLFVFGLSYC